MSRKELRRGEVLSRVKRGELRLNEAAQLLEVSYRQAKRLLRRYRAGGAKALVHGNVGRASNRIDTERREQALRLVREHYSGGPRERFGPTLASEHLAADYGIEVPRETLRRWMLTAGLWSRSRKRKLHRSRRQRRAHFGELIQLDGSHHEWLEGRGPQGCLMNFVDDATGRGLCRFSDEETTWAAADLLQAWVRQYGVPQALYCDWKSVYKRRPTSREALAGIEPETQFGSMCRKLGIRIIAASSPQAKGRVERHHGTHQDRLVKKMRLAGIGDYEAANRYLDEQYLAEHNAKFAFEPTAGADFHRRLPKHLELNWVFCLEHERVVSNDWVVRFQNRFLQLQPRRRQGVSPGTRVRIEQARDGTLRVMFADQEIRFAEIAKPWPSEKAAAAAGPRQGVAGGRTPAADHPWRRFPAVKKRLAEKRALTRDGLWK
ncbi:MAG: ISNCY family transposase [Acidobacteriota bacterium]